LKTNADDSYAYPWHVDVHVHVARGRGSGYGALGRPSRVVAPGMVAANVAEYPAREVDRRVRVQAGQPPQDLRVGGDHDDGLVAPHTSDDDPVRTKVLALISEKTGYPPDMLDLDLDLAAETNGSEDIAVVDGNSNTVLSTVHVGLSPYGIAYNPNTKRIYSAVNGTITVLQE